MKRWAGLLAALVLGLAAASCGAGDDRTPQGDAAARLIPRADIFGDPARTDAALNPQGDRLAFLAPDAGYLNIWVVPIDALHEARPVTHDRARGIRKFVWAETGQHILYMQDRNGDENWRVHVVDLTTGAIRDLTPFPGAQADIVGASPAEPNIVMIALNDRDRAWHDLYRIDILTGERTLVERNANADRRFADYFTDRSNRTRLALRTLENGSSEIWSRNEAGRWERFQSIPFEDSASTRFLSFESDGDSFLMLDSTGRDRAGLVRVDAETGAKTVLGESTRADVMDVWLHPLTSAPQAFAADYLRREWRALVPEAEQDIAFLDAQLTGEMKIISRSRDDSRWIVLEEGPSTPARTWLYYRGDPQARDPQARDPQTRDPQTRDPQTRRLQFLFRNRPALEGRALATMTPIEIPARDGLTLVSYLTLPPGSDANDDSRPEAPVPLVLVVHGGPWARDSYGFNATHQWLADRGYAALSVNFRGSAGFGKGFLNAGNGEWGAKMQEDLNDAIAWAVQQGIAQRERIAIMGQSYGGYAALAGLAFTPGAYACGVSLMGPSNLASLLDSTPPYWASYRAELHQRIGHPVRDAAMLRERSPIFSARRIQRPLLVAQGARDPRISREETDQFMDALRGRNSSFVYLLYPDEGHGLARPQNRLSFFAAAENFLGKCLGGPAQPMEADFRGASARTMAGLGYMPNLRGLAPPPRVQRVQATSARVPTRYRRSADAADPTEVRSRDLPIATAPPPTTAPVPEPEEEVIVEPSEAAGPEE